jgi:hypothetical protein
MSCRGGNGGFFQGEKSAWKPSDFLLCLTFAVNSAVIAAVPFILERS